MFVLLTFTCALLWATIPLVSSEPFFPTFTPIPDGINCKGDPQCRDRQLSSTVSQELVNLIDVYAGPDDRVYAAEEQIGDCYYMTALIRENFPFNGICASMRGTEASAGTIRYLAHQLLEHGCLRCGSVPINYPQNNDVTQGYLTFDYVEKPQPGMHFK